MEQRNHPHPKTWHVDWVKKTTEKSKIKLFDIELPNKDDKIGQRVRENINISRN